MRLLADIDFYDLVVTEDEDVVLSRLIADLPDAPNGQSYNARPGSVIYGLFQPLVIERARLLAYAREAFQQSFVAYATGEYLDQRALEAGLIRRGAEPAVVVLTITGSNGTEIPAGSQFATDGTATAEAVVFSTSGDVTIASGTASVTAFAVEPGVSGNVGAGTVTSLVLPIDGVDSVTNAADAYGGLDEQDDDSLRSAISERIQSLASVGNAAYYRSAALAYPGVGRASVDDLWDGNGTALLTVSGLLAPYVSPSLISEIQQSLDPSVALLFSGSETGWSGGSQATDAVEGQHSRTITNTATSASLDFGTALDLSDLAASDEFRLFVRKDSGTSLSISALDVQFQSGENTANTATASIDAATLNGLTGISSRAVATFTKSAFTTAGSFDWSDVTDVVVSITTTAACSLTFAGLRRVMVDGGKPEGNIPLGIQVTVVNGRARSIDVAATVEFSDGVSASDMEPIIEAAIVSYFSGVRPGSVIRVSEIANIIHDTRGVVDYTTITLDGSASNITLDANEGPSLGTLTITAA